MSSEARKRMEQATQAAHNRKLLKIASKICLFHGIDPKSTNLSSANDIMSELSLEVLPRTSLRHLICFHWCDGAKLPRISRLLANPALQAKTLEKQYEEACDIYSEDLVKSAIIAVIFEINEELFVFSRVGGLSEGSVAVMRWNNQIRFLYPLKDFLLALGAKVCFTE